MGGFDSLIVAAGIVAGSLAAALLLPAADAAGGRPRLPAIEGLRGLLAIAVVAHHLLAIRTLAATDAWNPPPDNFGNLLGQAAVALFFMLSAWLFTGQIVAARGHIDVARFFIGRVRRIVPAWLGAVLLLFGIVAIETGFQLHESIATVGGEALTWLLFPGDKAPDLNGRPLTFTVLSVAWSLHYEWLFYLGLPLLAFATRRWGALAPFALLILPASLFDPWVFFAAGALARPLAAARIDWRVPGAIGALALLATQHDAHGWIAAALLLPGFVAIVQARGVGERGGGLLTSAPLLRLGRISYSLYLFHNPTLYLLMAYGIGSSAFGGARGMSLFALAAGCGVITVLVAAVAHRLFEAPFVGAHNHGRPLASNPPDVRYPAVPI